MRSLRIHGKGTDKYDNVRIGLNSRLDTLQAAILLAKLEVFAQECKDRQRVASYYSEKLQGVVEVPFVPDGSVSAWAQYSIRTEDRAGLQAALKADGIPTNIYYPKPLHLQTAYSSLGYAAGSFPVAESVSNSILSLPMHPYLTAAEQDRVIESCRRILSSSLLK
jgi:UDP-2-acetamido-2-deoxy-ribo-hexuluronate aminotransferase